MNLAIETTSRVGSVTLGRGDRVLASRVLPEQRRHRVDLLPTIDGLCREHGVGPGDLREVYVSVGPGSFTGLRIAIATARTLAQALGVRLVAVPTLDVVAQNVTQRSIDHLAVCLNLKRDRVYAGLFARDGGGERWAESSPPALLTMDELLATAPRPLAVLGDPLPEVAWPADVRVLPAELAQPRSEALWGLGRDAACAGRLTDPGALLPLYVRPPEAVELWDARHGKG